uniref:Uncharacterized protein n=1 Tax=Utricularia reniformis TaxID=192314 RepID=A0A1Y0B2Y8_9LAMI|nr:hypothetical protein AEK19_MT1556 [Utricularia reniformis]ART31743.1 hypothetical protein AEK19_MT1556 [Utricularia reniformis]
MLRELPTVFVLLQFPLPSAERKLHVIQPSLPICELHPSFPSIHVETRLALNLLER